MPSVEYCQLPWVVALAVLPTTAIPARVPPGSLNREPNKLVMVAPAGLAVSSLTAANVASPVKLGAVLEINAFLYS